MVIEAWRVRYNTVRPHSSLGYRPPAPEALYWPSRDSGSPLPQATTLAPKPVMHQVEAEPLDRGGPMHPRDFRRR
ncbi:hypothetical protein D3P06_11035 [Paracoccus aestuarii]|uniref:Integrase catalytic domain-containing protein n=1 Tax=Paracoccus aestuarii TaxID=453842 RepID=A0A418ZVG3_9RHOB|nr:hypothetical protein D3P06_11035 [Paracoccus aestuarii]WCQ98872.1 transposase [Paracoccus aestuarii]